MWGKSVCHSCSVQSFSNLSAFLKLTYQPMFSECGPLHAYCWAGAAPCLNSTHAPVSQQVDKHVISQIRNPFATSCKHFPHRRKGIKGSTRANCSSTPPPTTNPCNHPCRMKSTHTHTSVFGSSTITTPLCSSWFTGNGPLKSTQEDNAVSDCAAFDVLALLFHCCQIRTDLLRFTFLTPFHFWYQLMKLVKKQHVNHNV